MRGCQSRRTDSPSSDTPRCSSSSAACACSPTRSCAPGVRPTSSDTPRRRPQTSRSESMPCCFSHLHADHVDLPSLRSFARDAESRSSFLGRRRAHSCAATDSPAQRNWHAASRSHVEGVEVVATPAVHELTRRLPARRGAGLPAIGFVVRGPPGLSTSPATRICSGGHGWARTRPLDLALLPVWGWGPQEGPRPPQPELAARARAVAPPAHSGTDSLGDVLSAWKKNGRPAHRASARIRRPRGGTRARCHRPRARTG